MEGRDYSGEIRQLQSAINEALSAAQNADQRAGRALQQISNLEDHVRDLIQTLNNTLNALTSETQNVKTAVGSVTSAVNSSSQSITAAVERVEGEVHESGTAITDQVRKNTTEVERSGSRVRESVESGFRARSQQEMEARLLDSRTELLGLVGKLEMARSAIVSEYHQAQRRGEAQKANFAKAFDDTKASVDRDIERVGSRILEIQKTAFDLFRRRIEEMETQTDLFELGKELVETNRAEREGLLEEHQVTMGIDLDAFAEGRQGFAQELEQRMLDGIGVEGGDFALRVHMTSTGESPEVKLGAECSLRSGSIEIREAAGGLGKHRTRVEELWEQARKKRRPMTDEELERLFSYLDLFSQSGVISRQELVIVKHFIQQNPIEIVEVSGPTGSH